MSPQNCRLPVTPHWRSFAPAVAARGNRTCSGASMLLCPSLRPGTACGQLERGHSGSIGTLDVGRGYKSGFPFPCVFLFVCLFCYPPTTPTPHRARGHWLRVWVWELSGLSSVLDSVLRPPAPDFTAQSLESSLLSGIVTAVPHRVSRRSNETLHAHGLDRCLATRRGSVRSDRCWSW